MKHDRMCKLLLTILLSGCIITSSCWNIRYIPQFRRATNRLVKTKCFNQNSIAAFSQALKSTDETNTPSISCKRISSKEAAELIEKTYVANKTQDENTPSGLLLITSDASRGANRHTGLTSILRHISPLHEKDQITIAARRVNSMDARDIFKSEVAALALGIKTAVQFVPSINRERVLLITDSNSALTFFCGDENVKSPTIDHPQYRFMQTLLLEADEIVMAKVKSAKSSSDGFFDHDAADVISSFTKATSNKRLEMYFQSQQCANKDEIYHYEVLDNDVKRTHAMFQTFGDNLSRKDLEYLCNSSDNMEDRTNKVRKHLILKKESGERLRRCKDRMRIDLGINLDD